MSNYGTILYVNFYIKTLLRSFSIPTFKIEFSSSCLPTYLKKIAIILKNLLPLFACLYCYMWKWNKLYVKKFLRGKSIANLEFFDKMCIVHKSLKCREWHKKTLTKIIQEIHTHFHGS